MSIGKINKKSDKLTDCLPDYMEMIKNTSLRVEPGGLLHDGMYSRGR